MRGCREYSADMTSRWIITLLFMTCAGALAAQEDAALDTQLQEIAAAHHGRVTLLARNLKTGQTASLEPDALVKTASVIKLGILLEAAEELRAWGRLRSTRRWC